MYTSICTEATIYGIGGATTARRSSKLGAAPTKWQRRRRRALVVGTPILYCFLYTYIDRLASHTNQKCFQCEFVRDPGRKEHSWGNEMKYLAHQLGISTDGWSRTFDLRTTSKAEVLPTDCWSRGQFVNGRLVKHQSNEEIRVQHCETY